MGREVRPRSRGTRERPGGAERGASTDPPPPPQWPRCRLPRSAAHGRPLTNAGPARRGAMSGRRGMPNEQRAAQAGRGEGWRWEQRETPPWYCCRSMILVPPLPTAAGDAQATRALMTNRAGANQLRTAASAGCGRRTGGRPGRSSLRPESRSSEESSFSSEDLQESLTVRAPDTDRHRTDLHCSLKQRK